MTLNQLTYFYHAATLQHFNQAAEKANISEPSLSRSIATLKKNMAAPSLIELNISTIIVYFKRSSGHRK